MTENDINSLVRRIDNNLDEEISFSDFFQGLLPYFIFGDLKNKQKIAGHDDLYTFELKKINEKEILQKNQIKQIRKNT